jgi:hypothetical protein
MCNGCGGAAGGEVTVRDGRKQEVETTTAGDCGDVDVRQPNGPSTVNNRPRATENGFVESIAHRNRPQWSEPVCHTGGKSGIGWIHGEQEIVADSVLC